MNIVLINDFAYVDGGASKICLGSAKALAALGHRVILFSAVGPIDSSLRAVANLEVRCLFQYEILDDPNRLRAASAGIWNQKSAAEFAQLMAQFSTDDTVVHVHTWTKALSSSVIAASVGLGFSVVLTMHDYFSACPTGGFFNHPKHAICPLRPMSGACLTTNCDSRSYGHKLWRVGRQWVQEHAGRLPDGVEHFISISALSEQVLRPFLPSTAKIHRVANFIDVEQSDAVDVGKNRALCFVGRLSPEKGPLLLAECARIHGLAVDFIGDGPLRDEIARVAPQARITGWLKGEDVRRAMRSSLALVFPSLWYETQGLAVAEAAAMGIPVIVPSTSAAREWVVDGETGLVFEGGDVTDLGEKILLLRNTPGLAARMGREGHRRYWESPATTSRHCRELERVYRVMLGDALFEGARVSA